MNKPIVGAIRWDGHHGDAGMPGLASEKCLGPKHYHDRLPFYSKIISDSQVQVRANSQQIMDQEIIYASEGGLDYWAFDIYPSDSPMMIGFLIAKNIGKIRHRDFLLGKTCNQSHQLLHGRTFRLFLDDRVVS